MKNFIKFSFLVLLFGFLSSCKNEVIDPPMEEDNPPTTNPFAGEIRDISSKELVAEMGVGWNLGNSLDVRDADKTLWGNPLPGNNTITAVKEMGFTTLRIPITWEFHQESVSPYKINAGYLSTVRQAVNYGIGKDMHVIINVHHDNEWVVPSASGANNSKKRLESLWTQIAETFIEYGDHLIFETLNEPRIEGSPAEWNGGDEEGRAYINEFNKAAVDAIRATGGNNAKRHIMVPTWAASTVDVAMNDLVIPNDDPNIIVSLHSYFPWVFCGDENGQQTWGTDAEKQALLSELDNITNKWIVDNDRAVILGEYGAMNKNNKDQRVDYITFYTTEAVSRGLLPIIWDDGGNFGLFDRHSQTWTFPEIAKAAAEAK